MCVERVQAGRQAGARKPMCPSGRTRTRPGPASPARPASPVAWLTSTSPCQRRRSRSMPVSSVMPNSSRWCPVPVSAARSG